MKPSLFLAMVAAAGLYGCNHPSIQNDYPIHPVDKTAVNLTDHFIKPRIDTNRNRTIPYAFKMCLKTGRIENFEIAGGLKKGRFCGQYPFDDSDVYKIIEGTSYSLETHYDKKLDQFLDSLIEKISLAQEADGYLETWRRIDPNKPLAEWWGTAPRWSNLQYGHELYNLGHLYEAAAAHYQATGKKNLLNIALKSADLITHVFGPGKKIGVPGHEEVEIGLMKLYRVTGNKEYLDLAKFFVDARGDSSRRKIWGKYQQDHMPVRDQREAVGHAVRAGYLYSAMTELTALTGDQTYMPALDSIWNDIAKHKLYITGGVGSKSDGEAFGPAYDLPNDSAYAETCAAISMVLWNHRMFLLTGNSKYYDFLEQTLYNGLLSGVGLSGEDFFYTNPLEFKGSMHFNEGTSTRQPWFACACCPSNLVRFILQIPGLVYAAGKGILYINLYISNQAKLADDHTNFHITMTSGYPWSGKTEIKIDSGNPGRLIFAFRIPAWTQGAAVDNHLYRIINFEKSQPGLLVNGKPVNYTVNKGYALIERSWQEGDIISIQFVMHPELIRANDKVAHDQDKVVVGIGPVMYCAEGTDNHQDLKNIFLDNRTLLKPKAVNDMGCEFYCISLVHPDQPESVLIPYSLWANRGPSSMKVWIDYHSL